MRILCPLEVGGAPNRTGGMGRKSGPWQKEGRRKEVRMQRPTGKGLVPIPGRILDLVRLALALNGNDFGGPSMFMAEIRLVTFWSPDCTCKPCQI